MTRKIIGLWVGVLFVLLVGVGALVGQESTEPLEAPQAVEAPEPPKPPAVEGILRGERGAWLGVRLRDVTADKARELKLPGEYGAIVVEVAKDSPAAKAGLEKNDVILEFAGDRVHSVAQLQRLVRETPPGRTLPLVISRAGQTRTLSANLEKWRAGFGTPLEEGAPGFRMPSIRVPGIPPFDFSFDFYPRGPNLGISGEELTRQLADYFGVKQGKGVLVREVVVGSAAEKAGLKAGDVIVRVDDTQVGSVAELRRALPRDIEDERKVNLTIVRDRREQTIAVELEALGRHPLRQALKLEIPRSDILELRRLAAEYQRNADQYQKEIEKFKQEWNAQARGWQKELQRQMKELERQEEEQNFQSKEEMGLGWRLRQVTNVSAVVQL